MSIKVPIDLLKTGKIKDWNAWKAEQTERLEMPHANLSGKKLCEADFSATTFPKGFKLEGANLSKANLTGAMFREVRLSGANLSEATLLGTHFYLCNLQRVSFFKTDITNTEITPQGIKVLPGKNQITTALTQSANFSGQDLTHANFTNANCKGVNFNYANLTHANFTGATCQAVDFDRANLTRTTFHSADCSEAIFAKEKSTAKLKDTDFNSANLSGAKLPDTMKELGDGIKNIEEASRNARGILYFMVALSIFTLLSLATTTDAQLILGTSRLKLPILGVEVPTLLFNFAAAVASLFVFVYFHLYVHKIVEILRDMPARFPDRMTLGQKMYPWLLNDAFDYWRRDYWAAQDEESKTKEPGYLKTAVAVFVAYCLMPLTVFAIFARTLPVRQWLVLTPLFIIVGMTIAASAYFYYRTKQQVCPGEKVLPWGRYRVYGIAMYSLLAFLLLAQNLWFSEYSAICNRLGIEKTIVPLCWGQPDFSNEELSALKKQAQYQEIRLNDGRLVYEKIADEKWVGIDLSNRDLNGANFQNAVIPNSNFQNAQLRGSYFSNSNLSMGNFFKANFSGSTFNKSQLSQAVFIKANFMDSFIFDSNLHGARFEYSDCRAMYVFASNLQDAKFQNALFCKAFFADNFPSQITDSGLKNISLQDVKSTVVFSTPKYYGNRWVTHKIQAATDDNLKLNINNAQWSNSTYTFPFMTIDFNPDEHGMIEAAPGTECEAPKNPPKNKKVWRRVPIDTLQPDTKPATAAPQAEAPESTTSIAPPPPGG